MSGRRRDPRFRLSVPWEGSLLVLRDVVVERRNEHEVWALSEAPAGSGQELTLDLTASGPREVRNVRVLESTPVVNGSAVRYRLRLSIID